MTDPGAALREPRTPSGRALAVILRRELPEGNAESAVGYIIAIEQDAPAPPPAPLRAALERRRTSRERVEALPCSKQGCGHEIWRHRRVGERSTCNRCSCRRTQWFLEKQARAALAAPVSVPAAGQPCTCGIGAQRPGNEHLIGCPFFPAAAPAGVPAEGLRVDGVVAELLSAESALTEAGNRLRKATDTLAGIANAAAPPATGSGERLDVEAAALAQRITDAVNAGERPVDDMGLASILHHFAHRVADDLDDAAEGEGT